MMSGGHEKDVGVVVPDCKYGRNKPESEFLTGQAESGVLPGGRALDDEV